MLSRIRAFIETLKPIPFAEPYFPVGFQRHKPVIDRIGFGLLGKSCWRCRGDCIMGFGETPRAAYDDWLRQ